MDNTETLSIILGLIGFFALAISAVGALKEYFSESPEETFEPHMRTLDLNASALGFSRLDGESNEDLRKRLRVNYAHHTAAKWNLEDIPRRSPKNTSYTGKPMENVLQELTDEQLETLAGQRDLIIQDVMRTAGTWAGHELHGQTNESAIMLLDIAYEVSGQSEYLGEHELLMLRDKIYNLLDFAKHELHIDRLRSESLATVRAAQQELNLRKLEKED